MKFVKLSVLMTVLGAGSLSLPAQEAHELEQLKAQLRAVQENFEKVQREQRALIEQLSRKVQELENKAPVPDSAPTDTAKPQAPVEPAPQSADVSRPLSGPAWQSKSGRAYVDVGLVGTVAAGSSTADDIAGGLQLGGHDPNQRGFTLQGVEAIFFGAVDPYFRGNANILFQIDADGETRTELEEAWLETMSLPAGLQLRAGQIYTEFGRLNPTHLHSWAFVDSPLVLGRFLGPDGLRNPGARLSWLAPTPFYSELFLSIQNSQGETATSFRDSGHSHGGEDEAVPFAYRHADNDRGVGGLEDMLIAPRYALSFDLTENQVLLFGGSAAFGPNSRGGEDAGDTMTQIYGLDLTWKWKSPRHHAGFPFVTFQTEGLVRRYEAGAFDWDENGDGLAQPWEVEDLATGGPAFLSGETLTDYGFYSQILYGFRKGWVAGLRFDYVTGNTADYEERALAVDGTLLGRDPQRAQRWRLAPNLTWYPTEFSKIRLQYNYDDRLVEGTDHSVWLQFEYVLGAHAAHRF